MAALEIFRILADEFKAEADETVNQWMALAEPLLSKKRFGALYPQALALLTAHKMKLSGLGEEGAAMVGAVGVASYSEGGVSISYSANQQTNTLPDAEYGLTAYGTQLLTLRRACVLPILSSAEG